MRDLLLAAHAVAVAQSRRDGRKTQYIGLAVDWRLATHSHRQLKNCLINYLMSICRVVPSFYVFRVAKAIYQIAMGMPKNNNNTWLDAVEYIYVGVPVYPVLLYT